MTELHWTLRRRPNQYMLLAWAIGVVAVLAAASPRPILLAGVGASAGIVIGVLQLRATQERPEGFDSADTALKVRQALWSTGAGKWSIVLLWAASIAMLGLAFVWGGNALRGYLAGYFSLKLARESVTFQATKVG